MADPNPSLDPRTMKLAAGTSGKQGFMTVALSDRAAKDYSKAMVATEKAGKAGVFLNLYQFVMALATSSSAVQAWTDFFQFISDIYDAATMESTTKMLEAMYSDESLARLEKYAGWISVIDENVAKGIDSFNALDDQITAVTGDVGLYSGAIEHLGYIIDQNINNVSILSGALGHANYIIENFTDVVEKLSSALKSAIKKVIEFWEEVNG